MLIVLSGSSDIGRVAIAEKLTKNRKNWRHLQLERIAEVMQISGIGADAEPALLARIACLCATEMKEQGIDVVLSCAEGEAIIPAIREALEDAIVAVHLGTAEQGYEQQKLFDLCIDTSKTSVGEACAMILKIL